MQKVSMRPASRGVWPSVWRSSRSPEDRRWPVIRRDITLVEIEEKTWTKSELWPHPWPRTYAKLLESHFDGKQGSKTNLTPPLFPANNALRWVCTAGKVLASVWHNSESGTELRSQAELTEYEWDLCRGVRHLDSLVLNHIFEAKCEMIKST